MLITALIVTVFFTRNTTLEMILEIAFSNIRFVNLLRPILSHLTTFKQSTLGVILIYKNGVIYKFQINGSWVSSSQAVNDFNDCGRRPIPLGKLLKDSLPRCMTLTKTLHRLRSTLTVLDEMSGRKYS